MSQRKKMLKENNKSDEFMESRDTAFRDIMLLNLAMRSAEVTGNAHVWQPSKRMNEWAIESEFFVDSAKALSADDSISAIA